MNYLYTFLQSNILEWCIYLPLLRTVRPSWSWLERAMFVTAMNGITHPVVFFFLMNMKLPYLANIMIAETFAVVAEALILCSLLKTTRTQAWSASLIANLISWQLAPMLTYAVWAR
jgi:phosphotransferase system  glucose/maltose/N-acetylglucosamine-specific IIC component